MKLLEKRAKQIFKRVDRHCDWYWAEWLIGLSASALIVDILIFCAIIFAWEVK